METETGTGTVSGRRRKPGRDGNWDGDSIGLKGTETGTGRKLGRGQYRFKGTAQRPQLGPVAAGMTGIATRSVTFVAGSGTRPQPICWELVRICEQCLGSAAHPTGNHNVGAEIAHRTEAGSCWSGCRYLRSGEPIRGCCACLSLPVRTFSGASGFPANIWRPRKRSQDPGRGRTRRRPQ